MKEITVRDICGDYALDIPFGNNTVFTLYFNSYQNALNVKRIIDVDGSVPNVATVCDMVEVVRCKYCVYGEPLDMAYEGAIECMHEGCGIICSGDHFCSYGKRKDGAE